MTQNEATYAALSAEFEDRDITLAIVLFRAYGDHCGWKSWDSRPMPRWDACDYPPDTPANQRPTVNDAVRSHWCAAARRARQQIAAGG